MAPIDPSKSILFRINTAPQADDASFTQSLCFPGGASGFFAISQRALALTFRRISPKDRCYMDAALRWEKGKLCFIIGKGKSFVSKWSRFFEENVSNFSFFDTLGKNLWTFLRNLSVFLHSLSPFFGKGSVSSSATSCTVLSRPSPRAFADTRLCIAHSASSKSLPSPFTFTPNSLLACGLWVNISPNLTLHR